MKSQSVLLPLNKFLIPKIPKQQLDKNYNPFN